MKVSLKSRYSSCARDLLLRATQEDEKYRSQQNALQPILRNIDVFNFVAARNDVIIFRIEINRRHFQYHLWMKWI